jgi:D-tyrosyl-tRNA(Tyr) deacylase
MKVVIQRVNCASVSIADSEISVKEDNTSGKDLRKKVIGKIGNGLLIFVGIEEADTDEDILWLAKKIVNLRLFNDGNGVMNLSVKDVNGEILIVSQFTLHASTVKGNRPSYIKAAHPDISIPLYLKFIKKVEEFLEKKWKRENLDQI